MGRFQRHPGRRRPIFEHLEARRLLTLVLSPMNITATQGGAFDGVVATLVDTDTHASPSDFNTAPGSVTIDWGDGKAGPGTVVGPLFPGVFEVDASHTYTQSSVFTTTITVTDQGGDDAIASGTADVTSQPPPLTIVGQSISGFAGSALTGVPVATFLDSNPADTASDFSALITWGDGSTTIGTIQGSNGAFTVTGTHKYASADTYDDTVTVLGLDNGLSGVATGTADITNGAPAYTLTGLNLVETAGVPFTDAPVARVADANTSDVGTAFSALINWGNGQTTAGTVAGSAGNFTIEGSYDYPTPGAYTLTVTVYNDGTSVGSTTSTAIVTGPALTAVPVTITPSIGQPFSDQVVATFFDTSSGPLPSATITWGDGDVSSGTVAPVPGGAAGNYEVEGSHTYTAAGTYSITVALAGTSGQSASVTSTAIVAAPTVIATGTAFNVTPTQSPVAVAVATFTDNNPAAQVTMPTTAINWGNGQTTVGQVSFDAATNAFIVTGTPPYLATGSAATYAVTVTIIDPSGQTATADSTAIIAAAGASAPVTGGLSDVITNGPHAAAGISTSHRPLFSGTASPYAIVQLYARPLGVDATLSLGEAVADGSGQWSLATGPLAAGAYIVTATVTISGGYPSNPIPLQDADGGQFVAIGLSPKELRRLTGTPGVAAHRHQMTISHSGKSSRARHAGA